MKVLIANRGTIACRIARTLRKLGIPSVAVYSEADVTSTHLDAADEAVCLGPPPAAQSYLNIPAILEACRRTRATAVHPGYGFLSENPQFARSLEENGIVFIGPTAENIEAFGLKHRAKELAQQAGVPILPSSPLLQNVEHALSEAARIGYPVLLKSTAGGGGIGMRVCHSADEIRSNFEAVTRLAHSNFKDAGVFLEKFLPQARHVEVQIFGDGRGHVVALQERDCSIQRRNQKILEETPAPNLSESTRHALLECAAKLGRSVHYRSAGTVEFLLDAQTFDFYFLEVNTRLQVEHGVTEEVYGIDLVEWMVRLARGESDFLQNIPAPRGHSIQARLYAEIPHRNFQPSTGRILHLQLPTDQLRIETHLAPGFEVTPHYDPLLAKLIATAPTREQALGSLLSGLEKTEIAGVETNAQLLAEILKNPAFAAGKPTTSLLASIPYQPSAVEVLEPGTLTTLQDWPGRVGYWDVGVPPSGPMDFASFRLANRLVGNPESAPALEITFTGPTLQFLAPATVALTGAEIEASIPLNQPVSIPANTTLRLGKVLQSGCRAYLAVCGGFLAPRFLGSSATFVLGQFGGTTGRPLRTGDIFHFPPNTNNQIQLSATSIPKPNWSNHWQIRVLYGPHGAPDFFTESDIQTFFTTPWRVHFNSNSTGIRLLGPKPHWARPDGGEAGLHPSNIHDNPYAIGTIDFTGDMPILLGTDGPSLGGFVCPATVIQADRWMLGQLRPDDTVQFIPVTPEEADDALAQTNQAIAELRYPPTSPTPAPANSRGIFLPPSLPSPICLHRPPTPDQPELTVRLDGDDYLLLELGPNILDLELRLHVHALHLWFRKRNLPGILDLTPGIRSLQIHFDPSRLPRNKLLSLIEQADADTRDIEHLEIPSRLLHLPLSWNDPAIQLAIEKYTRSVNPNAPWCPSNIEFIRRINGLPSTDDVHRIVFSAQYIVLGLGDVYLGAPVAIPLDPRHRLVTTKYNPARTWTAENSVGIGGAYLCIYGMEGPGGYQLFGRTLQVWNSHRPTPQFPPHKPWLLDFFDRIQFYPVSADELLRIRRDFPLGRFRVPIESGTFSLPQYREFLRRHAAEIAAFQQIQRKAFQEERERWKDLPPPEPDTALPSESPSDSDFPVPPNTTALRSPLSGNLWKILLPPNSPVQQGQPLAVIEAMKMETTLPAPVSGKLLSWHATEGKPVSAGQILALIQNP